MKEQVVLRAALLFNSLMNDYEEYVALEAGPERDLRSDMLVRRMQAMSSEELNITLLFTMDMLHKIGPATVSAALEKWITEHPEEEETAPPPPRGAA